jgi:hypothetical protein
MHAKCLTFDENTRSGVLQPFEESRDKKHRSQPFRSRESRLMTQTACRVGDRPCARAHATRLDRATISRSSRAKYSLLHLQKSFGNRYVQRVMALHRKVAAGADVHPEVEECIQGARGGGQRIDGQVRTRMESAFGSDFGGVRVHTDTRADALNQTLNARAFTTGQDIFFRQGAYNPGGSSGRELLAHELTHVVQQNRDEIQTKLTVGQPGDRYEQEADSVARAVIRQEQAIPPQPPDNSGVRRQMEEEEEEELQATVQREKEEEEALQTRSIEP